MEDDYDEAWAARARRALMEDARLRQPVTVKTSRSERQRATAERAKLRHRIYWEVEAMRQVRIEAAARRRDVDEIKRVLAELTPRQTTVWARVLRWLRATGRTSSERSAATAPGR